MFNNRISSKALRSLAVIAAVALGSACQAGTIYFNGFETDTSGWTADSCVPNPNCTAGAITRVSNGGGSLHLTAPEGTHYAELTNAHEAYSFAVGPPAGYGSGGFTFFGNDGSLTTPYAGNFFQAISLYVNTTWTAVPGQPAFWIDEAASDGLGFGTEHNFRLTPNGSSVDVAVDAGGVLLNIASSGWYTFRIEYSKGATGSDPVVTRMVILNGITQALLAGTSVSSSTLSSQLGGPGYLQFAPWKNSTVGDTLGIDAVQSNFLAPEPLSIGLVGLPLVALLIWKRRTRTAANNN